MIEDSERLRRALNQGLTKCGFSVDVAVDGEEGLAHARQGIHSVIVLDLMLPKLDGLTVLKRLRGMGCQSHVLILSAMDQVGDRVSGLNLGADDYLAKPFEFSELLARVNALIRRSDGHKEIVLRAGPVELDTHARTVRVNGDMVTLSRLECGLLELLLRARGRALSQGQIIDQLYPADVLHESNAVEALVYSLRRKIQPKGTPDIVLTRRGQGYLIQAT